MAQRAVPRGTTQLRYAREHRPTRPRRQHIRAKTPPIPIGIGIRLRRRLSLLFGASDSLCHQGSSPVGGEYSTHAHLHTSHPVGLGCVRNGNTVMPWLPEESVWIEIGQRVALVRSRFATRRGRTALRPGRRGRRRSPARSRRGAPRPPLRVWSGLCSRSSPRSPVRSPALGPDTTLRVRRRRPRRRLRLPGGGAPAGSLSVRHAARVRCRTFFVAIVCSGSRPPSRPGIRPR